MSVRPSVLHVSQFVEACNWVAFGQAALLRNLPFDAAFRDADTATGLMGQQRTASTAMTNVRYLPSLPIRTSAAEDHGHEWQLPGEGPSDRSRPLADA